jgi:hypothetical protein
MPEPPENGVYGPARRHRTRPNRRRVPSPAASLVSEIAVYVSEMVTIVTSRLRYRDMRVYTAGRTPKNIKMKNVPRCFCGAANSRPLRAPTADIPDLL